MPIHKSLLEAKVCAHRTDEEVMSCANKMSSPSSLTV